VGNAKDEGIRSEVVPLARQTAVTNAREKGVIGEGGRKGIVREGGDTDALKGRSLRWKLGVDCLEGPKEGEWRV